MKLLTAVLVIAAIAAMACGGDDDSGGGGGGGDGGSNVVITAADADRVAHAGLPTIDDFTGADWLVIAEDDFDGGSGASFGEFIDGNPECQALENFATLQDVFGGDEEGSASIGQAQVEFENQDPDALLPTSVEVEIEIDESAGGSRAQFAIVKDLFESDDTSNCLIAGLNSQFAETGFEGFEIEVKKGSGSASPPQDGARLAFDVNIAFAGEELEMAMQLYFWPYGNASVQTIFLGTSETLSGDFVAGILGAVDDNLKAAAGE